MACRAPRLRHARPERSLGGIDLDALLARLSTPEGAATLASLRGERDAVDHDQLRIHLDEDDEDDDDDEDDAELRTTRRHGRDDTETVTEASRGTIASSEPAASRSRRGSRGEAAAARGRPAGLPDGRGCAARDDDGPLRTRHETRATRVREIGGEICPGRAPRERRRGPSPPTSGFSVVSRARPSPTVRLNAWETMEPDGGGGWVRLRTTGTEEDRGRDAAERARATPPWTAPPLAGRIRRRRRRGRPPRTLRGRRRARVGGVKAARAAAMRAARRRTRARRTRSAFEDEPRRRPREENGSRRLGRSSSSPRWSLAPWRLVRRFCWRNSARATRLLAGLRLEGNERCAGDFDGASRAYRRWRTSR